MVTLRKAVSKWIFWFRKVSKTNALDLVLLSLIIMNITCYYNIIIIQ